MRIYRVTVGSFPGESYDNWLVEAGSMRMAIEKFCKKLDAEFYEGRAIVKVELVGDLLPSHVEGKRK